MLLLAYILSSLTPWFWPAVGAGAGLYFFVRGFQLPAAKTFDHETPRRRRFAVQPWDWWKSAASLTGPYTYRAHHGSSLLLPPHLGLAMEAAWQRKFVGKGSRRKPHVPFYLDDGTARVLVDPQGADLDIHRDFRRNSAIRCSPAAWRFQPISPASSRLTELTPARKLKLKSIASSPGMRCLSWEHWPIIRGSK